MNANKSAIWIMAAVVLTLLCMYFFPTVRAAGFDNRPQEYVNPYENCCGQRYQRPYEQRTERREPRQQEQYRNDQQPIVGDYRQNAVWDSNPRQIYQGPGSK